MPLLRPRREGRCRTRYMMLFRVWFWLGWPAFFGVAAIFALMLWKPAVW